MKKEKHCCHMAIKLTGVLVAVAAVFFYFKQEKINYEPCATKVEDVNLSTVETSSEMVGNNGANELFIAAPDGSRIFSKGGLNYIVAGDGADEIYFSLCSSKIIDGKVMVIENFNPAQDKIKIFCGHNKIKLDQIKVIHDEFEGKPVTFVEVTGKKSVTAIALLGDVDIKPEDIILNESFVANSSEPKE